MVLPVSNSGLNELPKKINEFCKHDNCVTIHNRFFKESYDFQGRLEDQSAVASLLQTKICYRFLTFGSSYFGKKVIVKLQSSLTGHRTFLTNLLLLESPVSFGQNVIHYSW